MNATYFSEVKTKTKQKKPKWYQQGLMKLFSGEAAKSSRMMLSIIS